MRRHGNSVNATVLAIQARNSRKLLQGGGLALSPRCVPCGTESKKLRQQLLQNLGIMKILECFLSDVNSMAGNNLSQSSQDGTMPHEDKPRMTEVSQAGGREVPGQGFAARPLRWQNQAVSKQREWMMTEDKRRGCCQCDDDGDANHDSDDKHNNDRHDTNEILTLARMLMLLGMMTKMKMKI